MIKRGLRRRAVAFWLAIAAVVLLGSAASPAASAAPRSGTGTGVPAAVAPGHGGAAIAPAPADTRQVCAAPAQPGVARCLSLIRTDVQARAVATAAAPPAGYGPSSLQSAYNLPSTTAGGSRTVAIVDAYDDPNAASDLAAYRSQYGLPACTVASGCFTKVNELGQASPLPVACVSRPWARDVGQVDDGVRAPQRLDRLAEVGQVGPQHPGLPVRPGHQGVRGQHVVAVLTQLGRDRPARLPARTRDADSLSHCRPLPLFLARGAAGGRTPPSQRC